jgi:hypothetical protein
VQAILESDNRPKEGTESREKGMHNKKQLEHKKVGRTTQHQFWRKRLQPNQEEERTLGFSTSKPGSDYTYGINMIVKGDYDLL